MCVGWLFMGPKFVILAFRCTMSLGLMYYSLSTVSFDHLRVISIVIHLQECLGCREFYKERRKFSDANWHDYGSELMVQHF
jgi:hypothetical protein